jgi:hypothetical protein
MGKIDIKTWAEAIGHCLEQNGVVSFVFDSEDAHWTS